MIERIWKRLFPSPRPPAKRRTRLRLEALEDRTVPTTTASLNGNALTITGDANANTITISEQGFAPPGSFTVQAADFNGGVGVTFNGVGTITVATQGGTDSVTFNGIPAGPILSGALSISGAGSLAVDINANVTVRGATTITRNAPAGALNVTIGGPNTILGSLSVTDGVTDAVTASNFTMNTGTTVNGFVSLNMGNGDNTVSVNQSVITGFLSEVGGTGNDTVEVTNSVVGQNLGADMGAGINLVYVTASTVAGNAFVTFAGSSEAVSIQSASTLRGFLTVNKNSDAGNLNVSITGNSSVNNFLSVVSGAGPDGILLGGNVGQNFAVNLGAGAANLHVSGSSLIAGNLTHAGTGALDFDMAQDSAIGGFLSLNMNSAATATIDANISGSIASFLSIVGGNNADIVAVRSSVVGKSADAATAFALGGSADQVITNGSTFFGPVTLTMGDGADSYAEGSTADAVTTRFLSTFSFLGGAGNDTADPGDDSNNRTVFAGATTFDGGTGLNTLNRTDADFLGTGTPPNFINFNLTAQRVFVVNDLDQLVQFDAATPGSAISTTAITGFLGAEDVIGIDFRPATGILYLLTFEGRLYTLDTGTAVASFVAQLSINLGGTHFSVDFDPVSDRIRVISNNGKNVRVDPTNGAVTVDVAANPGNPSVVASAHSNNFNGATTTTLFALDAAADRLVVVNPANGGTVATVGATVGVNFDAVTGFDIGFGNVALAGLLTGIDAELYVIDLNAGTATLVGDIAGANQIRGFALRLL